MVLLLMVFSDLLVMENWGISFLLFISYLAFFVLMLVFQVMWVSWLHFDLIPLLVPEENFWE